MRSGDTIAERFELLRLSAAGGMGRVYQALDRVTGDRVALKVLYRGGIDEAERFAREAQVLATLRHPGIVRYIAYGTTDTGEPYLVLEWLDGETLNDRIKERGLALPEALALGVRVASALGAAHQRGDLFAAGGDRAAFVEDRQHVAQSPALAAFPWNFPRVHRVDARLGPGVGEPDQRVEQIVLVVRPRADLARPEQVDFVVRVRGPRLDKRDGLAAFGAQAARLRKAIQFREGEFPQFPQHRPERVENRVG